jgi:hypothetical protein
MIKTFPFSSGDGGGLLFWVENFVLATTLNSIAKQCTKDNSQCKIPSITKTSKQQKSILQNIVRDGQSILDLH